MKREKQKAGEPIKQAAERLWLASQEKTTCAPVRDLIGDRDLAAAYAVQEKNTRKRTKGGGKIIGRKIGLASPAAQQQFGVSEPNYGMLFDDMDIPQGSSIAYHAGFHGQGPRVETEIALVLERDVVSERPTTAQILSAVDYAVAALEIVASHISDWDVRITDMTADNASGAGFVLGHQPRLLRDIDVLGCGMEMTQNDSVVSSGKGEACLGSPLNALRWLATEMTRIGRPLLAGDVIMSGALGPMVSVVPGDVFVGRIEGLGSVSVSFASASG